MYIFRSCYREGESETERGGGGSLREAVIFLHNDTLYHVSGIFLEVRVRGDKSGFPEIQGGRAHK